ncbi:Oxygen-insensitive NADPH nitroreductase [hydrothermal vent metagenome]|uniref:Oxygen-insensitive NADPH nitroreductase n=1 Tax=hydrothermal vent metagenome TaxID=652676 RepID=A0A1W1D7B6_9ZZZZ
MKNPINYSIHEALNARQSPYAFDPERKVRTDAERVRKSSKDFILHGHTDVDYSKTDKS